MNEYQKYIMKSNFQVNFFFDNGRKLVMNIILIFLMFGMKRNTLINF